jgi:solute carrier family 25 oxoglutarate transporter 11
LFKGSIATVLKAISVNASLTGPYDYLREKLWITFGDFGFIDTVATIWASFWGTLFTLPIDNIKTKL